MYSGTSTVNVYTEVTERQIGTVGLSLQFSQD